MRANCRRFISAPDNCEEDADDDDNEDEHRIGCLHALNHIDWVASMQLREQTGKRYDSCGKDRNGRNQDCCRC